MKYLLTQLFLLISSVIFLYYFSTIPSFAPVDTVGEVDWVNVSFVFFFIFLFLESFISLVVFIFEKFLAYGRKEFPESRLSLKWGLGISLCLIAILFLHINHLITIGWGIVMFICFVLIIIIV